jgi:hypothetical protein
MLCEDTANALGRVLKDNAQYVLPVIVVLKTPPDIDLTMPTVTLNIGELTHGGFHLQINAELRTGFRSADFTRELVRVLLAERILRNHQKLSTTRKNDVLPAWVMTGVAQALEYRSRSRPSALFSAVFKRGQVYSLDRIIDADPTQLDALSRGIYETSTCALVLTLLDQPDGAVRFSKFLNDLAVTSKSDRDLLTAHFPNLATSKSALEKWWSLQMAAMATPTAMEMLGVAQTEEELDNALTLQIPGARKREEPAKAAQAAPEEKKPRGAPPGTAPEEKKSRGIFGWMKREPKEQPAPVGDAEEKKGAKAPEEESKSAPKQGEAATTGTPIPSGIDGEPAEEHEIAGWTPLPLWITPLISELFGESRNIIFGFKKKPKGEEETAEAEKGKEEKAPEDKPKEGNAKDAKKAAPTPAPAAAPSKPKKGAKADEPVPELSRKPGETRSVGGRPEDLPKAPPPVVEKMEPPVAETKGKKAEEPKADEAQSGKVNPLNPKNWFRKKNAEPDEKTAAAEPEPAKPAPHAGSEPPPRKVAAEPTTRAHSPKPGSIPLEEYALLAKRDDRSEILTRCLGRLSALKMRAHPLYKPLIADYAALVEDLRQEKTKGASKKLEDLRQQRGAIHEKALAVESHLDWYEANHTGTMSHAFDDFLRLDSELDKDRLPRNDDLSKYLDGVEGEFK